MISGIILSTGTFSHNGIVPALTKMEEKTFLRYIVNVLRSAHITDIVIIDEAEAHKTLIFSPLPVYAHLSDTADTRDVKSSEMIYDW